MRDRDRRQAAAPLDLRDAGVGQHRVAVPEHVAGLRLQQQRPLVDGERRLHADAGDPLALLGEFLRVRPGEVFERRPILPGPADVLPVVVADRATRRRRLAVRKLRPALLADESRHASLPVAGDNANPDANAPRYLAPKKPTNPRHAPDDRHLGAHRPAKRHPTPGCVTSYAFRPRRTGAIALPVVLCEGRQGRPLQIRLT